MRFVFLIFLLVEACCVNAQGNGPVPAIILKLAAAKGPVNTFSFTNDPFIRGLPYPFEKTGATFVKTQTDLLAMVNGTGRVYTLDSSAGEYNWRRMDSTFFTGYNMACLTFYADSTVWSFGGYGLWNNNGHLRYFSRSKFEWEVKPLNREIPHIFGTSDLFWLDTTNTRLYMLGIRFINDALKDNAVQEKELGRKTWCLDIRNGNWTALGESPDTTLLVLAYSPWGMLTYRNNIPSIADFTHNRYLKANASGARKFSTFSRGTRAKQMAFFIDSTLYFGDFDQYMDSIAFTRADFIDSGVAIYTAFPSPYTSAYWLLLIVPALLAGIIIYRKQKKPGGEAVPEPIHPLTILDERDRSLLHAIYSATRQGNTTDIDTINSILGVTNKTLEIQKRQRSDALNAINTKMAQVLGSDTELIIRSRSAHDGRTFNYAVNPVLLSELEGLLNRQK